MVPFTFPALTASNLTHDFYRQLINPKANNKQLMFWSRLTVLIIALGALIVAFNFTGIIAIYQWALRLTATTIVLPFLATMLWRGVTKTGAMSGMLLGLVSTLVWPYLGISFDQTFFGFIFCAIGLFGGSLLTRHAPEENVAAVLWEDLPTATERQKCGYAGIASPPDGAMPAGTMQKMTAPRRCSSGTSARAATIQRGQRRAARLLGGTLPPAGASRPPGIA